MMNITIEKKLGETGRKKAVIKTYKATPGDFDAAAHAAAHYAKKLNRDMVLVPGNSYMHKVYHIAQTTDDLWKYTGMPRPVRVALVNSAGEVFQAQAS